MATVGSDKRLSYYRQTPDEVLAELASHRLGLTEPEATRRLHDHGLNALDHTVSTVPLVRLGKQLSRWPILALLLSAILSGYLHGTAMAGAFVLIALLLIISNTSQQPPASSLDYHLDHILPTKAVVLRGAMAKTIPSHELVIGDIVQLAAGDIVPADVRLLEEDQLVTDDSLLTGESRHSHKFTHAMSGSAPLVRRHNLAWLGTRIVSGEASGVVVATGLHTELGRLLVLSRAASPHRSPFATLQASVSRPLAGAAGVLAIITAIGRLTGQLPPDVTLEIFALLAALLAIPGLSLTLSGLSRRAGRMMRRWGVDSESASRALLAQADLVLLDQTDFVVAPGREVAEFMVGKRTWRTTGSAYNPAGAITTERGGRVSKHQLAELQLFFEAAALSSRTTLLPPDAEHTEWHVTGPAEAGAVLALAARAGLSIEQVRADHATLHHHAYDASQQFTTSVRAYDHRTLAFSQGPAAITLERCSRIWDAGHTHALGAAERQRLQDYIAAQTAAGRHVVALAYRAVAKADESVDRAALEQQLTLLGLVTVAYSLRPNVQAALQRLHRHGIAVNMFSVDTPELAAAIAAQAGLIQPTPITEHQVAALAETQVAALLEQGDVVFCGVSPDSRLRLVDIGRRAGHHVAVTGRALQDIPALQHAAIGIAGRQAPAAIRGEASVIINENNFSGLTRSVQAGRRLRSTLRRTVQSAMADNAGLVWLATGGIVGAWLWNVPPALTAPLALLWLSLVQCLPLITLGRQHSIRADRRSTPVLYGLTAALIALAGFLVFFAHAGISPRFIDANSRPYREAVTLVFVILAGCSWLNAFFAYGLDSLARRNARRAATGIIGTILLIGAVMYLPVLQDCFGSQSLDMNDWLWVVIGWVLYGTCRLVGWHAHHHSRHEVLRLHRRIHGSGSPAKI